MSLTNSGLNFYDLEKDVKYIQVRGCKNYSDLMVIHLFRSEIFLIPSRQFYIQSY